MMESICWDLSGFGASKAALALGGGEMENEYYMCSIVVVEGCGRGMWIGGSG